MTKQNNKSAKRGPANSAKRGPRKSIVKSANAPAAFGSKTANTRPKMHYRGDTLVVEHCEYVQDIISDTLNQFAYDVFELSPTNATTHPWLANIAKQFETNRYKAVHPEFRSACPTSQSGKLIMGVDYDARDPSGNVSKAELLQWEGTVSSNFWSNIRMNCSERSLNTIGPRKFTADDVGGEERLTTSGLLYVATTSTNASVDSGVFTPVNFGELWIHYIVELEIPAVVSALEQLATLPQLATKFVLSSSLPSSGNIALGMDVGSGSASTPTVEPYGIRIETPTDATQYLQTGTTSTFASISTPLFIFDKDFSGMMSYQVGGNSFTSNTPASLSVTQYTEATKVAGSTAFQPADVNTSDNVVLLQDAESGTFGTAVTNTLQVYIKAVKGTALRIASNIIAASAAGIIKSIVFAPISPYRPKGDLRRNLLESNDDDGVVVPRIRPDRIDSMTLGQ